MTSICMYFQVHQPDRLGRYSFFDINSDKDYFSEERNREIFERAARKCYYPTNNAIKNLIYRHDGKFKISFSITGTFIEQCERYDPGVLDSFRELVDTGMVDLLDETYYHSLAYLISKDEFKEQVKDHRRAIKKQFGYKPTVFRNTEAMYTNDLANLIEGMGYRGIIAEGWDNYLGWKSPNYVYKPVNCENLKLMMRNYKLSDDVSFRFSNHSWEEFPLTAEKYAGWLSKNTGQIINLFMDYETFGEHQWQETGIFNFLDHFPDEALRYSNLDFLTTKNVVEKYGHSGEIDVPYVSSWADVDRDLTAWLGNKMQCHAFDSIKQLEGKVKATGDKTLLKVWRKLQTSDHFYYMCTKWFADGDIHKYFNDYDSPYDAFTNFMNVLSDFKRRVDAAIQVPS